MSKRNEGNQGKNYCALCGKLETHVSMLIRGPSGLYICNNCIVICNQYLLDEHENVAELNGTKESITLKTLPEPAYIKSRLDEYVIGQDRAKRTLSVAVYNHYKRILQKLDNDVEIQKSNILLLGPTGVGKTYLAQNLARILKVPFAISDATTLTEAGYVGEDVENILLRLIQAAEYDIALAEKGIIYIDEVDKISRRSENRSITRDVSGEGVQQALLKILEGTVANVPPQGGRKHPNQDFIQINTENILFICGGSFDGITDIIEKRLGSSVIGFSGTLQTKEDKKQAALLKSVESHDVIKYGLIPELVGRLPSIVSLDGLDKEAFIKILNEPKNAIIKQYKKLFDMDGVELEFTPDAIEKVAQKAIDSDIGARGLRSIMENILQDIMFEVPSNKNIEKVIIDGGTITGDTPPVYILSETKRKKSPKHDNTTGYDANKTQTG